ncbi:Endonuclease/exonuclease/phosphatase [Suillus discolor]|uniref:Endonuclease/exonuclease/phosphatase n=1 Tax=Suillus discolor TaxID=1912936 RepID=A0A9P7FKH0_9AGAM|nr:Endonuclease/exonuclease/phosphatase [Suillus discolor]KAG2120460.1 Endonuclease/exonuclease/phosphatase [Suillus discolor]
MTDSANNAPSRDDLKIWQQNLCKSPNAWEHMLKNLDPESYDLTCIQDPYLNPVNLANTSNLRSYWDVIYPSGHNSGTSCTQVIMLVNKHLSNNNWHIIPIKSLNVMAIELTGQFGKVRIYNTYNPCDSDHTLHFLKRHMSSEERSQCLTQGENRAEPHNIIWMGG